MEANLSRIGCRADSPCRGYGQARGGFESLERQVQPRDGSQRKIGRVATADRTETWLLMPNMVVVADMSSSGAPIRPRMGMMRGTSLDRNKR